MALGACPTAAQLLTAAPGPAEPPACAALLPGGRGDTAGGSSGACRAWRLCVQALREAGGAGSREPRARSPSSTRTERRPLLWSPVSTAPERG